MKDQIGYKEKCCEAAQILHNYKANVYPKIRVDARIGAIKSAEEAVQVKMVLFSKEGTRGNLRLFSIHPPIHTYSSAFTEATMCSTSVTFS